MGQFLVTYVLGFALLGLFLWACWQMLKLFGIVTGTYRDPAGRDEIDTAHRCQGCGDPTVVMKFDPAARVCYRQCGYWLVGVDQHGREIAEWRSLHPVLPRHLTSPN